MDADDTLPWPGGEAILRAAVGAGPEIAGFVVPVRFVTDDPVYGTRVDHVKLFRNRKGVRFEGRIHEQILPSLRASGGEIVRLDAEVLHSGYDTSEEGQRRKRERDYRLLDLDLADAPNHPFKLFNYGMTLHYDRRHEEALDFLRRSVAAANPGESHVRKAHALARSRSRRWEEPRTPLHATCRPLARNLPTTCSPPADHLPTACRGFKTHLNLAGVLLQSGRYPEARDRFRKAVELHPRHADGIAGFLRAALSAGDLGSAEDCLVRLGAAEGPSERWAELSGEVARAVGGVGAELDRLRSICASRPHRAGPRKVLARRLAQEGFHAEALPHLVWLESQGVAEAAFFLGVNAQRAGRFEEALTWMERALSLNPGHERTRSQVEALRQALGLE